MERKTLKKERIIKLMILAAGMAACIAGCGEQSKNNEKEQGNVKLSVLLQAEDYQNGNVWKGESADRLYEETGITLSLISVDLSGDNRLEQYMVTGTLPDVMIFQGVNQARVLMDAGLLMPWNQYEPLLENLFEEEAYRDAVEDSVQFMGDGENLLLMPIPIHGENQSEVDWLPFLRYLPYSSINTPEAGRLEDYLDIVEEMKSKMPYTLTGHETYGFSLSGEGDVYTLRQVSELGYLYGLDLYKVSPLMETNPVAGTTVSIFREKGFYKRALHFFFEANQRGLLDLDSRNQTKRSLQEKYESGSVMFGVQEELTKFYRSKISERYSEEHKGDAYIPVLADDMKIYRSADGDLDSGWYIAVNALSSNKEKACEFLNWIYNREEQNLFFSDDASVIWSEQKENEQEHPWKEIRNEEELQKELDEKSVYDNNEVNRISPASVSLIEKMKAIGEVNCQFSWDMIYAENEEQFEALWDELCDRVTELGMDEVERFYRKAYEKARKEQ